MTFQPTSNIYLSINQ